MEGLYRKVTRGYYSRINKGYSEELSKVLKCLIKVKPSERMTARKFSDILGELLELPIFVKKMKKHKEIDVEEESVLLKTIKLTKNINYLTEKLPKPNYSPLKYKSMLNNRSALEKRNKIDLKMKFSLPPIKNSALVKSERKMSVAQRKKSQ